MSQRPPTSPHARSPQGPQKPPPPLPPPTTVHDERRADTSMAEGITISQAARQALPTFPMRAMHGAGPAERRSSAPSRDLGMRAILNPTEPDSMSGSSRRTSAATSGSPSSVTSVPPMGTSPVRPSPLQLLPPTRTSPAYASAPFPQRRVLTPRSPRIASLSRGLAAIDAQQTPFVAGRSRAYTVEPPHAAHGSVTTPPAHHQPPPSHHGFAAPTSNPAGEEPRRHSDTNPAAHRAIAAQHDSPVHPSSHSPATSSLPPQHASSLAPFHPNSLGPLHPGQPGSGEPPRGAPPGSDDSSSTAGQTLPSMQQSRGGEAPTDNDMSLMHHGARDNMSMMTISTAQGLIHVPVDTHQASRLADEKRARNAGASARFRQRRKDKEREATTNIDRLQQQVRELTARVREAESERDCYRAERDRYMDIISRVPSLRDSVLAGPTSPHAGSFAARANGPPTPLHGSDAAAAERPTRRQRTNTQGDFLGVAHSLAPLTAPLPPISSQYGTLPPPPVPPPQQAPPPPPSSFGLHSLPPLRIDNGTTNAAIPQAPSSAAPTTAGPATPFGAVMTPSSGGPGPSGGPDSAYARRAYDRPWPSESAERANP